MKRIIRSIGVNTLSLFLLPMLVPGFKITGGFVTLLTGGACLAVMLFVLKPILNFISLPINILTLGFFSIVTNTIILYLLTIFISGITIVAFGYPKTEILGVVIPAMYFQLIFAYIYSAFVLSFIDSFFWWIIK